MQDSNWESQETGPSSPLTTCPLATSQTRSSERLRVLRGSPNVISSYGSHVLKGSKSVQPGASFDRSRPDLEPSRHLDHFVGQNLEPLLG